MLVQREVGTHPQTVQLVAQVGTPQQTLVVQLQAVAVAHQINLLHVTFFRTVETLETRTLQVKCSGVLDGAGNILSNNLYLIRQTGGPAARVEFEQQQVVVAPFKDIVSEV